MHIICMKYRKIIFSVFITYYGVDNYAFIYYYIESDYKIVFIMLFYDMQKL